MSETILRRPTAVARLARAGAASGDARSGARTKLPWVALAGLLLTLVGRRANALRPPLCDQGRFAVDSSIAGATDVVLAGDQVSLDGLCPPTTGRLVHTVRGTRVRARWPVCGDARDVRLRANADASCTTLRGSIRVGAPPERARFTARCADGCATAPPFACLDGPGPLRSIDGTHDGHADTLHLPAGARVDARRATFLASPANLYPIVLGGGAGVCLAGGDVQGRFDRTLDWETMHDMNNAGVRIETAATTVDGVRVDDVTDGIRPIANDFTIRGAWLSYVRDDCVENDHVRGGVIDDSLFDGCYVGVSERPSPAITASGYYGRGLVLTVRRSLIRLEPMPGPRDGSPLERGNGQFFKWDDAATDVAIDDSIFLAEQVAQGGPETMAMPASLTECRNDVMVWLGPGDYPAPLPPCFTVRKDRHVWDDAVAAWHARHPRPSGN